MIEVFAEGWQGLTPEQRFAARMDAWLTPALEFASAAVELEYRERVGMLCDAIELRQPSRVPVAPWIGLFPGLDAGLTVRQAYTDYDRLFDAWQRFHGLYRPDVLASTASHVPVRLFEALDYRLYDWPGRGLPDDAGYQYNEREWMTADEYDLMIADPSNYWQRFYLPRVFGALAPWASLAPFTDLVEGPSAGPFFAAFGTPEAQDMLRRLLVAGEVAAEWAQALKGISRAVTAAFGIPGLTGGTTKAPFDILSDTMRGTRGSMMDRYRRPEKILAACERLVPLAIDWGVRAADANRHPIVFIPLHKGADGFLSEADFGTFYWPTLKRTLLGLIEQGVVPLCFAEGSFDTRSGTICDPEIPAGRMIWMFDATDMKEARRRLGGYQCFGGNVPGALLTTGSAADVEDYVRRLITEVAGPGGFILGSGIVIDRAKPECVKALIDAGLKYGTMG